MGLILFTVAIKDWINHHIHSILRIPQRRIMEKASEIPDNPPPDFSLGRSHGPYSSRNGPFYHSREKAVFKQGFRVQARHCNGMGRAHGGMIMTLADSVMGSRAYFASGQVSVTVQLGARFLDSAREGAWVEAHATERHLTRNLVFCDAALYERQNEGGKGEKILAQTAGVFHRMRGAAERLRKRAYPSAEPADSFPDPPRISPPKGFRLRAVKSPFLEANGPFFEKHDAESDKDSAYHVRMPVLRRHCNRMGVAHGGMMMTLADSVLIGAAARRFGRPILTVQMEARLLSAARLGDMLEARAWNERSGGRLAFCNLEIKRGDRLVLLGSGVFRLPPR